MFLSIASLNSGSNGNCYYIGNTKEAVLIDVGLSCRETEIRMKRIGLSIQKVKAIFISHEHTDHIKGLSVLCKKYQLPAFITEPTLTNSRLKIDKHLTRSFKNGGSILVGDLSVSAFQKQHDAIDPFSFVVSSEGINVGVFTDIGRCCENLCEHFKICHAAFLEANYDETMLEQGGYPQHLKNRIRGGKGHLSNRQALELFIAHKPAFMSHLFLSHLSRDNNDPKLVHELFSKHSAGTHIEIASRYKETEVFHIPIEKPSDSTTRLQQQVKSKQISLF